MAMLGCSCVLKLQWLSLTHRSTHMAANSPSSSSSLSSAVEIEAFYIYIFIYIYCIRTKNPSGSNSSSHMPFFLGRCNDPFAPDEHKCVSEELVSLRRRRVTNGSRICNSFSELLSSLRYKKLCCCTHAILPTGKKR